MDGSVVIKAVLDTANIPKQISKLNSALEEVSWKGIKEGDDSAQKLSASLKGGWHRLHHRAHRADTRGRRPAFSTASSYEQATARIQSALGLTAEEAERLGDVGEGSTRTASAHRSTPSPTPSSSSGRTSGISTTKTSNT